MAIVPKCKSCRNDIDKADESSFVKKSTGYFHVECEHKGVTKVQKPCSYCTKEFETEEEIVKRGSFVFHAECLTEYWDSNEKKAQLKAKMRACPECKESVDPLDEESVDNGVVTLHKACHEKIQRKNKNREELMDYISMKYNVKFPTGYMLKQISEYHNKRGYSYKAMLITLQYAFDVEKIPLMENAGVGIIPHLIEKAKRYHAKMRQAGKTASISTIDNTIVKVRSAKPKERKRGYIDLNSL